MYNDRHEPERVEDSDLLATLVVEVQQARSGGNPYAEILKRLMGRGFNPDQQRHIFSVAFCIPQELTKAISFWAPDGQSWINDTKLKYEMDRVLGSDQTREAESVPQSQSVGD